MPISKLSSKFVVILAAPVEMLKFGIASNSLFRTTDPLSQASTPKTGHPMIVGQDGTMPRDLAHDASIIFGHVAFSNASLSK